MIQIQRRVPAAIGSEKEVFLRPSILRIQVLQTANRQIPAYSLTLKFWDYKHFIKTQLHPIGTPKRPADECSRADKADPCLHGFL
jgi:hypothetical protein